MNVDSNYLLNMSLIKNATNSKVLQKHLLHRNTAAVVFATDFMEMDAYAFSRFIIVLLSVGLCLGIYLYYK